MNFTFTEFSKDDAAPDKVAPGTAIDPVIMILRVAEAIAVGFRIRKSIGL